MFVDLGLIPNATDDRNATQYSAEVPPRRLSKEGIWRTGCAQTITFANGAMNAMCKELGQGVSYGTNQDGEFYFLPPQNTDSSGSGLVGGSLGNASGNTAVKFYPSNDTGATQGSNTGGALTGITSLWRATAPSNNLSSSPHWAADKTWSQMQSGKAGPAGVIPEYPDVSSLTFSTTGLPANTVRVTLVMSDKVGGQTSSCTVSRVVYLTNHN